MRHKRRRVRVPPSIVVCFAIVAGLILAAIFAPLVSPHDPTKQSLIIRNRPPAWVEGSVQGFPLGTDDLGRDILSRVLFGARVSLGIGFFATIIGTVLGTVLGVIAGYFRGAADWIIMLAVDAQLAM